MDLGIAGRRALVTGASRGIGAAVARALAREGAVVLAVARNAEPLQAVCDEILQGGGRAIPVIADVTDESDRTRVVADAAAVGGVDILVNNVGAGRTKPVLELTYADWTDALDLNLLSAVGLTVAFVPGMVERGWGRVVHVGTIAAREPGRDAAAYAAAKAGLLAYSKALSGAVSRYGVLSNTVLPGATATEGYQAEIDALVANGLEAGEAAAKLMGRRRPAINRPTRPDETANAVVFLCSDAASAITGANLPVDGGTVLGAW